MTREHGFAARLRQWRHRRGWSQLDLAARADISQRHLSFLELARAAPSRDMVLRLATALDIPLKSGSVSAEGDLDFRGTLGVAKDAPVGFAQIRLRFDIDTDVPQEKLDSLLKLTERYCVVYQTIKSGPPIEVKLSRI
jgi:transcriptional regulator with XRE-family HTH domain